MLLDNYKYSYRKYFRSKLYFPNREKPYNAKISFWNHSVKIITLQR